MSSRYPYSRHDRTSISNHAIAEDDVSDTLSLDIKEGSRGRARMTTEVMLPEAELRAAVSPVSARRIGLVATTTTPRTREAIARGGPHRARRCRPHPAPGHMDSARFWPRRPRPVAEVAPVLAVQDSSTDADGNASSLRPRATASPGWPGRRGRRAADRRRPPRQGAGTGDRHAARRPSGAGRGAGRRGGRGEAGGPVDVVAYAGSHAAMALAGGVLFVNPAARRTQRGPADRGPEGARHRRCPGRRRRSGELRAAGVSLFRAVRHILERVR